MPDEANEAQAPEIPAEAAQAIARGPALFKFSAHAIEDLGVNLYTSMGKALVEFVANAWDARGSRISIAYTKAEIEQAKTVCKAAFIRETADADRLKLEREARAAAGGPTEATPAPVPPLETRCLPAEVSIVIEDDGDGMDRGEIEEKFLVVGRRRRRDDAASFVLVRDSGSVVRRRLIMGRKGLGKLAGFGIAHRMVVTSRKEGSAYSTRVTLDYDALILAVTQGAGYPVPTDIITGDAGLPGKGTRIELNKLVYQSITWDPDATLEKVISRNFGLIRPEEFAILLNGAAVTPEVRVYQWSYPVDEERDKSVLIPEAYTDTESGRTFAFNYRFRFLEKENYLPAAERGVRVYAHNRLAALPSLLGLGTSPRGFRYSDYLDGVIEADFIDDLQVDLVATDRSTLRWEIPPLAGFRTFMADKLKRALSEFAEFRSELVNRDFDNDDYTKDLIQNSPLPPHRKRIAKRFARVLAQSEEQGVNSPFYKSAVAEVVQALDHGDILAALGTLAASDHPELPGLVTELTRLTKREFGEFLRFIQVRLKAIQALRRLVTEPGFREAASEKDLHNLLRDNPWLINPQFFEWMISNRSLATLAGQLEERLRVGRYVPAVAPGAAMDARRPDLVSVIGNAAMHKVVIIELKVLSRPLVDDNLSQLTDYMDDVTEFLRTRGDFAERTAVEGYLIGTMPDPARDNERGCRRLLTRIGEAERINPRWRVLDITEVLGQAELVHREFVELYDVLGTEPEAT